MNSLDEKLRTLFPDKVIDKSLLRVVRKRNVPRYVTEYLLNRYFTDDPFEAVKRVNKTVRDHLPEEKDRHLVLHRLNQEGRGRLIGLFIGRFDTKLSMTFVDIPVLGYKNARIPEDLVERFPGLLQGGLWGIAELEYNPAFELEGRPLPIAIVNFAPFQVARLDLEDHKEKRSQFTTDEWIDVLVTTMGLNPAAYTRHQKLLLLTRFAPLVEPNTNLIELGPRATGKTFSLRNASFYSFIISGAKVTAASLFVNLATSEVGILGKKDCVVFDEVNATRFDKGLELLAILKDYMASGVFSRGRSEITSECSIIFVGNTDVTEDELGELDEAQQMDLADDLLTIPGARTLPVDENEGMIGGQCLYVSLPQTLQDAAFLDRIHGFIPGWRIPKVTKQAFATGYGFVTDYFCEIMHLLRKDDFNSQLDRRTNLVATGGEITSRDEDGILKTASGLLKLICPHGRFTETEMGEVLSLACEYRGLVAQQQYHLNRREFPRREFGFVSGMM